MDEKKNFLSKLGSNLFSQPGLDDLLAMSSHANGFKRENAVRRLGMLGNPLAIPYLIVRANDWVAQVRVAAYEALIRLLKTGNGEAFVASLPAILHLQTCGRADHGELLQAVQDFLLREDNAHDLVAGLHSSDPRVARLVARLLVGQQRMSTSELITRGLSHKDVVVRSIVTDLLRGLGPNDFAGAVAQALRDPYMPVRREGFQQLLDRDPEAGLKVARDFLFDASASIREIAVHRLLASGEPVEQIYANALTGDRDRVAIVKCVLWGWGHMNSQTRIGQVRRLLDSRFPTVRRSALQAITKLLRDDAMPHLETSLADVSPAVCNEAARLISRIDGAPIAERLIAIAKSSDARHVAVACCRVIRNGNKWGWLKFILSVYGAPDTALIQEAFSREIDVWEWQFNRSSAQPDQRELVEIEHLLRCCEAKLTVNQVRLLKFTLRSYGATL